jgi:redox-sensing transcriptional repressor
MEKLEGWLAAHPVDIAVLSVPKGFAQDIADVLVEGGVRAIWNFAPVDLMLPEDVAINNVHLSDSLHALSFMIKSKNEEGAE